MAEEKKSDKPKIIVDEDWKAQAEADKQHLAEQEQGMDEEGAEGQGHEMPSPNFSTLVSGLVSQILFATGGIQDPRTGKRYMDLALAKHHIDTLTMLEEKTRGNLTEEEKKLLDQALYEVRMLYVRVAQGGIGT